MLKIKILGLLFLASILISCKKISVKNSVESAVEAKLKSKLQKSDNLISIEKVKTDTLSEEEIASFISNISFQKIEKLRVRQFALQKNFDSLGKVNSVEQKSIQDSINYFHKIVENAIKTKNSEEKSRIQNIYRITIENKIKKSIKTTMMSLFTVENELQNSSEFYESESVKFLDKK